MDEVKPWRCKECKKNCTDESCGTAHDLQLRNFRDYELEHYARCGHEDGRGGKAFAPLRDGEFETRRRNAYVVAHVLASRGGNHWDELSIIAGACALARVNSLIRNEDA